MGLDMYLEKKTYVQQWAHQEVKNSVSVKFGTKKRTDIKPERVSYIVEQVMYWRKANHIHQWFVDNCQGGQDDCREAYVSEEQLKQLAELCESVVSKKQLVESGLTELAENELPTQKGFFFGSTEYDEYYFETCEETAKVIRELLNEKPMEGASGGDFYYSSSW